jgi:hypothetical protein
MIEPGRGAGSARDPASDETGATEPMAGSGPRPRRGPARFGAPAVATPGDGRGWTVLGSHRPATDL